ncbi:hypothetical protein N8087_03170 [Porticoccaceae bacterium]|nr:hypothetical protein [Porticoccaceae bacterium]
MTIYLGASLDFSGQDRIKGTITEVDAPWLKMAEKKKTIYINIGQIKKVIPI